MTASLRPRRGPRYAITETGCWEWQAARDTAGYGRLWYENRLRPAHRVFFEVMVGPVPAGFELDHLCRNRACVNPAHLEPVIPVDNVRRGLRAKLTLLQVREMRALSKAGVPIPELANRFEISRATAHGIIHYKHFPERGEAV